MVLDHNLLDGHRVMTRITFEDGTVTMRGGKVATEEECRCKCITIGLQAAPQIVDVAAIDWYGPNPGFDPWEQRWNDMKDALEAAGWTVTINVNAYTENGEERVSVSMDIDTDCCFDCDAMVAAMEEANNNNGAITDQPDGLWVNVNGELPIDYDNNGIGIGFGTFYITGCCGRLGTTNVNVFQSPESVNGVGGGTDTWIPSPAAYCNPLP